MACNKLTRKIRERILALGRRGLSQRRIAEILVEEKLVDSITQQSISSALHKAGIRRRMAKRTPKRSKPADSTPTATKSPPLPESDDDSAEARILRENLTEARVMKQQARLNENVSAYERLAKLELELASRLDALVPPNPPDPENDPSYQPAIDRLHAAVLRLVERHEQREAS